MTVETRNQYGFPIVERLEAAKQYAAAAKERNKPDCTCETCKRIALLPAIQNIIAAEAIRSQFKN